MTAEKTNQTEVGLPGSEYLATAEELWAIDAAMASIDAGEVATADEIHAAFEKFRTP